MWSFFLLLLVLKSMREGYLKPWAQGRIREYCVCVYVFYYVFFFNIATGVIYIVTGILCIKNILLITAGISKRNAIMCSFCFLLLLSLHFFIFLLLFIPFICLTNNVYAWINLCFKVVIAPSFVSLEFPSSSLFLFLYFWCDMLIVIEMRYDFDKGTTNIKSIHTWKKYMWKCINLTV